MQAAEYFDSIAQFWDMEYSDNELAREITASISIPRGGGYTLDIGCGSGGKRTNALSETLPKGIARMLKSAAAEAKDWAPFFRIDCICDTDDLYLISGRAVAGIGGKL